MRMPRVVVSDIVDSACDFIIPRNRDDATSLPITRRHPSTRPAAARRAVDDRHPYPHLAGAAAATARDAGAEESGETRRLRARSAETVRDEVPRRARSDRAERHRQRHSRHDHRPLFAGRLPPDAEAVRAGDRDVALHLLRFRRTDARRLDLAVVASRLGCELAVALDHARAAGRLLVESLP